MINNNSLCLKGVDLNEGILADRDTEEFFDKPLESTTLFALQDMPPLEALEPFSHSGIEPAIKSRGG